MLKLTYQKIANDDSLYAEYVRYYYERIQWFEAIQQPLAAQEYRDKLANLEQLRKHR